MRRKFTSYDIQLIIDLYNNGKQQREIAQQLVCSQVSVSNVLRRQGIQTRVGRKIIYTDINKSFFNEINCEANAYFLGFLYADGCVQTKNNAYTMTLKLKKNDQIILEKFRDIMSPSSSVKTTGGKYAYFRVNQKDVCEQLITLGCIPNKSLILDFPTCVPEHLISHFMRGYSDGDGSICKNIFKNKKTINIIWKFVSTKQFCAKAKSILEPMLNIHCSQSLAKPKKNQITTVLTVGGNLQVKKALDWLYQDATIYLPRKYEKYQEFVDAIKN